MSNGAPPCAQSSMGPMMRRRHQAGGSAAADAGPAPQPWFDVFARVDEDLAIKTETGAAVTIGFWVLMVVLCIGEVKAHQRPRPPIERVVVDSTLGQRLRINADITFHAIPCMDVHVDAMDVAGENQMEIDHDMWKQRLGPDGTAIGEAFTEMPGEGDVDLAALPDDYCGSCFGAKDGCCQTCKEVSDAYKAKGWSLQDIKKTAEQCIREHHIEIPVVEGEGCNLSGYMSVNKVSGNFHVAAGEGVMQEGRHVHIYTVEHAKAFNTSHTINRLSFGDPYEGMTPNPLDGTSRIIDEDKATGSFQYFIKLVPTMHATGSQVEPERGAPRGGPPARKGRREADQVASLTSQFAYTFKFRSLTGSTEYHTDHDHDDEKEGDPKRSSVASSMLLPGVFFVYDVSPFMVEIIPAEQTPISHLLIRLCAVAGGAFAVSGIVDSAVFHMSNRLRRHGFLGQ